MSVTATSISSGLSKPQIRAMAMLAVRNRPSGVDWKMPSTAFSTMLRYFSSACRRASSARLDLVMSTITPRSFVGTPRSTTTDTMSRSQTTRPSAATARYSKS